MQCHVLSPRPRQNGIAMVIVMVTITILGAMAASLAFSMKVETTLAYNSSLEPELEWMARSGVEYARYILALQSEVITTSEPYDSLNQIWAGGPGSFTESFSDDPLEGISLKNNDLGPGSFSLTITDTERWFNINVADQVILNRAMVVMGASVADIPTIVDSILDWRDPDTDTRMSGAESEDYLRLDPPYLCKDGPIDDLTELLLVQGITPEMFYGPHLPEHRIDINAQSESDYLPAYPVGFLDLFTPIAERLVNVNTASINVLQLVPGIDESFAISILEARAGPDGVDGTEDDTPFASIMEIPLPPEILQSLSSYLTVRSTNFEVLVDVKIGNLTKQYVALLRRNGPQDIQVLSMHEN